MDENQKEEAENINSKEENGESSYMIQPNTLQDTTYEL